MRLLTVGLVLLLGAPLAGVVLGVVGPTLDLAASPPTPLVAAGGAAQVFPPLFAPLPPTLFDIAYVVPTASYVVTYSGGVAVISENTQQVTAGFQPCAGTTSGAYYPGEGANVFVACEFARWTNITVFNVSSLRVVENITIDAPVWVESLAFDPSHHQLFCAASDSRLRILDIGSAKELSSFGIQSLTPYTPMYYDPVIDRLLIGDYVDELVMVLDPASDSIVQSVPLPGLLHSLSGDPARGRVLVTEEQRISGIVNTTVLNATTFAKVGSFPGPYVGSPVIDSAHHRAYLNLGGYVDIVDLATLAPIPSALFFGAGRNVDYLAFGSVTGTLVGAGRWGGQGIGVAFLRPEAGSASFPAFSAVPLVGAALPTYLGVGGFFAGVGVFGARGLIRRRESSKSEVVPSEPASDHPAEGGDWIESRPRPNWEDVALSRDDPRRPR